MASIQERIIAAASYNQQLLKSLEDTDYASSSLRQSSSYLETLSKEISTAQQTLKKASATIASEYADHKRYRDSHMKRLAFKLGGKKGKFQADATKEEREWHEAVRVELLMKSNLEHLNQKLIEGNKTHADLTDVLKLHDSTKSELDALYKSLFDGPSPSVPGEDEKEYQTKLAEEAFNNAQLRIGIESQARATLLDANKFLVQAIKNLDSALDAATADAWGIGGSFADMSKHTSLSRAQSNICQVESLIGQAQRTQPLIQSIGDMNVAEMHFMTDVVFDNIFSDMNARARIKGSHATLLKARARLEKEVLDASQRLESLGWECNQSHAAFNEKREELQRFRAQAIETIANSSTKSRALKDEQHHLPPPYTQ